MAISRAELLAAVRASAGHLLAAGLRPEDQVAPVAAEPEPAGGTAGRPPP
ncbi:hypothetical protein ACFRI7_24880 [Streptomyces sp. NPDC056716]